MKKRSKLDLSPDSAQEKSQAAGFDADIPEASEPQPEPIQAGDGRRQTRSRKQIRSGKQASGRKQARSGRQARTSVPERQARPSRKLIMMSVVVIAVAAVSLFVLKKR